MARRTPHAHVSFSDTYYCYLCCHRDLPALPFQLLDCSATRSPCSANASCSPRLASPLKMLKALRTFKEKTGPSIGEDADDKKRIIEIRDAALTLQRTVGAGDDGTTGASLARARAHPADARRRACLLACSWAIFSRRCRTTQPIPLRCTRFVDGGYAG